MKEVHARLRSHAPVFEVADLPSSLAHYCAQLGFEIEFNYEGAYASVVRDGCRIHLKSAAARHPGAPRKEPQHIDVCFSVDEIDALSSSLTSAGAPITVPLREMPYGKELYVTDPDGYVLAFVQPWPSEEG